MSKNPVKTPRCVMDASVLLAVFNQEPCDPKIPELFDNAVITTFNLAEAVSSVLIKKGGDVNKVWSFIGNFVQNHYSLDDDLSYVALAITSISKQYGLSLGDRYCLALAKVLQIPVYTADKIWKELEEPLNIKIHLIR